MSYLNKFLSKYSSVFVLEHIGAPNLCILTLPR